MHLRFTLKIRLSFPYRPLLFALMICTMVGIIVLSLAVLDISFNEFMKLVTDNPLLCFPVLFLSSGPLWFMVWWQHWRMNAKEKRQMFPEREPIEENSDE